MQLCSRGQFIGGFAFLCYFSSFRQETTELPMPLLLEMMPVTLSVCRLWCSFMSPLVVTCFSTSAMSLTAVSLCRGRQCETDRCV